MKKRLATIFAFAFGGIFALFGLFGCNGETDGTENFPTEVVAFTVDRLAYPETTLLSYMQALEDDGQLTFTVVDGMVTEMNGVQNTNAEFWMIYVCEKAGEANYNEAYFIRYQGKRFNTANYGVETLALVDGATYVFAYHGF